MLKPKYQTLKIETLFQGYFRLNRYHIQQEKFDNSGWCKPYTREVLMLPNAAYVLPFDPIQDKVVLIEQLRSGVVANENPNPWMIELVAGMIDSGESAEQTARREAVEEAGCTISDLHKIAECYPSSGSLSHLNTIFIGCSTMPENGSVHGKENENEYIRTHVLDASKAISMLYSNQIRDTQTLIAMQWFAMHHTEIRTRWIINLKNKGA